MESSTLTVFASIALIQTLGWLSPGPNLVAVSGASMSSGRPAGLATALGIAVGVGLWAALAVFGVALVFEAFPALFLGLKLAGAAFLCWMGYQYIRSARHSAGTTLRPLASPGDLPQAFRRGFLVLMTNPKAPIFFGAILTSFLPVNAPFWVLDVIVLEFLILSFILNGITALLFSTRAVMAWFSRHQSRIRFAFGIIFILLGLLVARDVL